MRKMYLKPPIRFNVVLQLTLPSLVVLIFGLSEYLW